MTVLGDAETFKQAWTDGLVKAYERVLRPVPAASGVLRNDVPTRGRVAVLIGGGCGHYPAFAGLVGPGLAHGAVIGDVFTSPSAEQVYRTARAADGGAGVLFSFGNYSGDVMHFGLAARRLHADGIASRTVLVTDDVASGPEHARRGVAGGFFVFRAASVMADRGASLDEVERVARKANSRTRSFGVAFDGCTLPGSTEPLFTVPPGTMELGLGIHGEPGVEKVEQLAPAELADALVDRLLDDLPTTGDSRVAVLLNGLGRTKYEEMFGCYGRIDARLRAAGLQPCHPEVGEFVTSLDMAGMSLSLLVLDDELAELLDTPGQAPGYRSLAPVPLGSDVPVAASPTVSDDATNADESTRGHSRDAVVVRLLDAALTRVREQQDHLGALDAVAGDGDHGLGMVRGLAAAVAAAGRTDGSGGTAADVGAGLLAAGTALADAAGGASGALYGTLLSETGARLRHAGDVRVSVALLVTAVESAQAAVAELGETELGDKTMLDAIDPFRRSLAESAAAGEEHVVPAWQEAAVRATQAAADTQKLAARQGRAARLDGDRSLGSPDPGAVSFGLMVTAIGEELARMRGPISGVQSS